MRDARQGEAGRSQVGKSLGVGKLADFRFGQSGFQQRTADAGFRRSFSARTEIAKVIGVGAVGNPFQAFGRGDGF